ncbi:glycosyltransferase [Candidatus Methylacidithermus pantelleriae]|uniref:Glycosyltransferase n=1 Tax=Candidatus Methylacidithermus pantelleriae TaxID=2744239 RepID=A0A8J2BJV2_9BACT|nr:glycosyltransferase [Candidatus Methylacidithermus pantelleriae]CAF0700915.1 Glycosyltransferase [Candidatus Methylacidithermus pantelleriae]
MVINLDPFWEQGMQELHVVLPIYNEKARVEECFFTVLAWAHDHCGFEFSFVDDGSCDGTGERLLALAKAYGEGLIRVIVLEEHRGKGYAIRKGFASRPELDFCFTDGDLAYPLDLLLRFREELLRYDLVIGSRGSPFQGARNAPWIRQILGWGFNSLVRVTLGLPYRDTQAGLKAMRKEVARAVFARSRVDGFAADVELLWIAQCLGFRVRELPVTTLPTHSYNSTRVRVFRDSLRMLGELASIAWNHRNGCYRTKHPCQY